MIEPERSRPASPQSTPGRNPAHATPEQWYELVRELRMLGPESTPALAPVWEYVRREDHAGALRALRHGSGAPELSWQRAASSPTLALEFEPVPEWRVDEPVVRWQIHCPICGGYVEQGPYCGRSADEHVAEEETVSVHADRDDYELANPLGTRGGWTEIDLSCPNGCAFRLVTANHKGAQYLALVRGHSLKARGLDPAAGRAEAAVVAERGAPSLHMPGSPRRTETRAQRIRTVSAIHCRMGWRVRLMLRHDLRGRHDPDARGGGDL